MTRRASEYPKPPRPDPLKPIGGADLSAVAEGFRTFARVVAGAYRREEQLRVMADHLGVRKVFDDLLAYEAIRGRRFPGQPLSAREVLQIVVAHHDGKEWIPDRGPVKSEELEAMTDHRDDDYPNWLDLCARVPVGSVWRHRSGGHYRVTGFGMLEHSWRPSVAYIPNGASEADRVLIPIHRELAEFLDGRFTRVDPLDAP